ncbi:hypothetical protein [Sphingobium chungbukense]|uniref:Uncharacterized protein n=1 Tax=Sphingobium chungbukense TaxID=56193 RepID=A0A0M3ARW1_9SPHN|nr:hypothetical protein [Sphingobium chungbukense]KKW92643.1 hypothetical protein YP76_06820 [Sphingobium chungbukense]
MTPRHHPRKRVFPVRSTRTVKQPDHWVQTASGFVRARDSDASFAQDPKGLGGVAVAVRAGGIAMNSKDISA